MQIAYLMIKNLFSNLKLLPLIQKKNNNSKKIIHDNTKKNIKI